MFTNDGIFLEIEYQPYNSSEITVLKKTFHGKVRENVILM